MGVIRRAEVVRARRDGKLVVYSLTPLGRALLDVVLNGSRAEVT